MDIAVLKEKADLLKVANNKKYCLIPELSKELKVSKTELTQFILSNPKLIYTENIWSYREKNVKRRLWANDPKSTYNDTVSVKNKNLGLGIVTVYLQAKDNYRTDEWLQEKIATSKKVLHINDWSNYGYIEGYYVNTDLQKEDDRFRMWLWRNTPAKMQWLRENGYLHRDTFSVGGFGDCAITTLDTAISLDKINELKQLGWSINDLPPLSR